ncbi:hypothetical protein B0H10DRAFT_119020 [Mycena sp. CBHHK59/15]|nr:hypothetical protein B0H10DRAFT_119020 [Mycena sp. CBHHK59/15]
MLLRGQKTPKRDRLVTVLQYASTSVSVLRDIAQSSPGPFLATVASLTTAILTSVQTVKSNRHECLQMVESIRQLLCAMIDLHRDSNDLFRPATLHNVGNFARTLQMIYTFVEVQQSTSKVRRFFRRGEISLQLKECKVGLQQAVESFTVHLDIATSSEMAKMRIDSERQHEMLMALLQTKSVSSTDDSDGISFRTLTRVRQE